MTGLPHWVSGIFDKKRCGLATLRCTKNKSDTESFIGSESERSSKRGDRVQDGTDRIGKWRNVPHCGRIGGGSAASNKPGAIRFAGDLAPFFGHHQMQEPRPFFCFGAGASGTEDGAAFSQELSLHEEIAEDRMGQIRPRNCEHNLSVTCQLERTMRAGMIRQRNPSYFHVVFRRHTDFRVDFQVASALAKLSLGFRKGHLITFSRTQSRLISSGPEFSGRDIAHINESSPAIARGIFTPTRDCQITPATVSAARGTDGKVITAIGEKLNLRGCQSGTVEDAHFFGCRRIMTNSK